MSLKNLDIQQWCSVFYLINKYNNNKQKNANRDEAIVTASIKKHEMNTVLYMVY